MIIVKKKTFLINILGTYVLKHKMICTVYFNIWLNNTLKLSKNKKTKLMIALITNSLKKATKHNQILIFVFLCICDPYIHMNIIVAKKKTPKNTDTLFG